MLEQMREGTKHPLLLLMFAVLVIVFVFEFGGVSGSEACGPRSRSVIASVNGTDISNLDLTMLTKRVGQRTDEAQLNTLLRQSAEKLGLLHLLAEEATNMGMAVSDEELRDFLLDPSRNLDHQVYFKEGKFDPDIHERFIVYYLEMTKKDYEEFKRKEVLAHKYLSVLEKSLTVLPAEVDSLNVLRNTKVNLEFIRIDPKKLEEVITFSDAEVTAFASANNDKISKYYEDNKGDYSTPKEVRVRRIMIKKAPDSAAEADKKKANDAWDKVKDRILTKKEDFATVVKELSEDIVYKDKGGDMGWSKLEDMNEKTSKIIDGMKKGEVKEDISGFAYFLLKLDDVKDAKVQTLAEVRNAIARKLIFEQKGKAQIGTLTTKLINAAKADPTKSLSDVLESLKPKAVVPTEVPTEEPGDKPEDKPGDEEPAKDEEPVKKEEAPKTKTPWDVLSSAETGEFTRTPRRSFRFDPVTKGIVPTSLPWTDVPRIGENQDLARQAFKLSKEKPLIDKVIEVKDASFIVRLKERKDPTPEELKESRPRVETELRSELVRAYLGPWQTIFYRPDGDLAETSPWLAALWQDAIDSGKVKMYQTETKATGADVPAAEGAIPIKVDTKPADGKTGDKPK